MNWLIAFSISFFDHLRNLVILCNSVVDIEQQSFSFDCVELCNDALDANFFKDLFAEIGEFIVRKFSDLLKDFHLGCWNRQRTIIWGKLLPFFCLYRKFDQIVMESKMTHKLYNSLLFLTWIQWSSTCLQTSKELLSHDFCPTWHTELLWLVYHLLVLKDASISYAFASILRSDLKFAHIT